MLATKDEALKIAGYDLDGVIADVEKFDGFDNVCLQTIKRVRSTIAKALEQPAQEPVAWIEVIDHHGHKTSKVNLFDKGLQLADGTNLYTHPHQWQGLTDDEILKASSYIDMLGNIDDDDVIKFAHAIEAKLKEKNHV